MPTDNARSKLLVENLLKLLEITKMRFEILVNLLQLTQFLWLFLDVFLMQFSYFMHKFLVLPIVLENSIELLNHKLQIREFQVFTLFCHS